MKIYIAGKITGENDTGPSSGRPPRRWRRRAMWS